MNASPLGRYSEAAALVTALSVMAAWLAVQVGLLTVPHNPAALNAAATFALGLLLGQRSTTNGAGKLALAAHARLDALSAPPANDGAGPVVRP